MRNVGSFDGGRGPFRTWALAVSRNVCRDMLRRRGVESGVMLEVDEAHLDVAHVGIAARRGARSKTRYARA